MRISGFISALFIFFTLFFCVVPTQHVFAQTGAKNSACAAVQDGAKKTECENCMGQDVSPGVWTAIGCIRSIDVEPTGLLEKILGLAMGMAGGIAFLLILFGGFQIMTSAGNPEQLNAGRELVTSAITGLLLVIFSIFILQFIGVNIIGIPGFG